MKSFIKNLSVVAIIVAMVFAFIPTTIFAADNDITITVNGAVKERTLSAYKLFTIEDVDGDNYYYSWSDTVKAFFQDSAVGYEYETILDAIDALKDFSASELDELATKFHDYAGISAEDTQTAGANATSLDLTVSGSGYYIVYDETTSKAASVAMLNNVTEDTEIDIKIDEISTPEKTVNDLKGTSAAIGEIVEFKVTSKVPTMAGYTSYKYDFVDTLSEGLTYINDATHPTKVVISGATAEDDLDLSETNEYDVTYSVTPTTTPADGEVTLTVALQNLIALKDTDYVGKTITVTYYAKVNSDAIDEAGSTENEVKIQYSNNPYDNTSFEETPPDIVHVYTYTVDFTKKNTSGDTLQGAKFVLKSGNQYVKYNANSGEIELVTPPSGAALATVADYERVATVMTSGANGEFSFEGLKEGTYTLVEIEAPEDYQIPSFDGFTFTLTPAFDNAGVLQTVTFTYDNTEEIAKGFVTATTSSTTTSVSVEVLNAKEGFLPTTGGMGTKIFTAVGIVVMLAAAVALVYRNKKNND